MNIFITGAGGYIGGSIAAALLADGHRVRGLTRTQASASQMAAMGIEPVLGTLDDSDMLSREAQLSDGVINTASSDHAGAVRSLLDALAGSAKPLLHTSGSSVIGDDARGLRRSDVVFDEDTPLVVDALKQPRRDIDLMVLTATAKLIVSTSSSPKHERQRARRQEAMKRRPPDEQTSAH